MSRYLFLLLKEDLLSWTFPNVIFSPYEEAFVYALLRSVTVRIISIYQPEMRYICV